jgi:hypothetical protein
VGQVVALPHDTTTPLREIWWGDSLMWKAQFEIEPGNAYECPHNHWTKAEALRCRKRLVRFMLRDPRWQPSGKPRKRPPFHIVKST